MSCVRQQPQLASMASQANLTSPSSVAIGAGVLAAILPARRASRLNVLEALQYE